MATDFMLRELAVFQVINATKPSKGNALKFKCTMDEYKDWCNVLQETEDTEYPAQSAYDYSLNLSVMCPFCSTEFL